MILDFVGASYWEQNVDCLGMDGKLILISTLGGTHPEKFSLGPFLAKRLQVMGTTLRSRSLDYKKRLTRNFAETALPLFEEGRLQPILDRVFPWDEVGKPTAIWKRIGISGRSCCKWSNSSAFLRPAATGS